MLLANFDRKEHLRHRAVSLRQHGFLVEISALMSVLSNPVTVAAVQLVAVDTALSVKTELAAMTIAGICRKFSWLNLTPFSLHVCIMLPCCVDWSLYWNIFSVRL